MAGENEIVKSGDNSLAAYNPADYGVTGLFAPGTEDMDASDVKVPRLKIGQPLSKEVVGGNISNGDIFNSITQEIYSKFSPDPAQNGHVDVIFLNFLKTRAQFDSDMKLIHMSTNGKHCSSMLPREDGIKICAECPDSLWTVNDKGEDVPPRCPLQSKYLTLISGRELEIPLTFLMKKSSMDAAKELNTEVKLSRLPFYAFVYRIATKKKEDGKRVYWIPVIQKVALLRPDTQQFKNAEAMYKLYSGVTIINDDDDGSDNPF